MIALCSKCNYIEESEGEKNEFSTKWVSKKKNEITWQCFTNRLVKEPLFCSTFWYLGGLDLVYCG